MSVLLRFHSVAITLKKHQAQHSGKVARQIFPLDSKGLWQRLIKPGRTLCFEKGSRCWLYRLYKMSRSETWVKLRNWRMTLLAAVHRKCQKKKYRNAVCECAWQTAAFWHINKSILKWDGAGMIKSAQAEHQRAPRVDSNCTGLAWSPQKWFDVFFLTHPHQQTQQDRVVRAAEKRAFLTAEGYRLTEPLASNSHYSSATICPPKYSSVTLAALFY